jgi:hypothetical protein
VEGGSLMNTKQLEYKELSGNIIENGQCIVYYFDKLIYGTNEDHLELSRINEAFLFNDKSCLHIYRDGELKGVLVEYDETDEFINERRLGGKNTSVEEICIRKFIDYDIDGQAYYKLNIPYKLKLKVRRNTNG